MRPRATPVARSRRLAAIVTLAVSLGLLGTSVAGAGEFDRRRDDHPLALVRYVFYPVGMLLEATVFRPAHEIASAWLPEDGCFARAAGCDEDRRQRQRYRAARR